MRSADGLPRHRRAAQTNDQYQYQPQHPPTTYSAPSEEAKFHGSRAFGAQFTQFIAPAQQFWTTAQNSLQSLTESYSDPRLNRSGSGVFQSPEEEEVCPDPLECQLVMPHLDRTAEFRTVVKSCQMRIQAQNGRIQRSDREKLVQSTIRFNQLAKRIGHDLCRTCARLEQLTELVKKKSLFDDRGDEEIHGLNTQIAGLQDLVRANQQNSEQGGNHSKLVVVGLQAKLASLGTNFKSVQEIRTENLKHKSKRREKFSQSSHVPYGLPPAGGSSTSLLLEDEARASASNGSVAVDMQQLQGQERLIDETQQYHRDRFNAIQNVESSITEIGQIFNQLSMLVAEQGEVIVRIDDNVEQANVNVEAAHLELLRYFHNISKNRWLMIKVFGVLMAFFVFFVVFLT